jgi:hypothetical protein
MLEEIDNIAGIKYADHRTMIKVVGTCELFMMSCLLATQGAVAQVRGLAELPTNQAISGENLEIRSRKVMDGARAVVIEYIHEARRQATAAATLDGEDGSASLDEGIRFPADGFWPTPPATPEGT